MASELERDPVAMAMLAAWMNCTVEQLPPENCSHLNPATMAAWKRVAEAAQSFRTEPTPVVAADELVELAVEAITNVKGGLSYAFYRDAATAALSAALPHIERGVIERESIREEVINTPETADFMAAVPLEAAHQRERWGADHDSGKSPFDWFWLVGYLAQKAASSAVAGDDEKAMHHTISTAAALANWHAALSGKDNRMMPGAPIPVQAAAIRALSTEHDHEG